MKKLILFALLLSNLIANAQRNNNISREDLYSILKTEFRQFRQKGFDICIDSKSTAYQLKQKKDKSDLLEPISKSDMNLQEQISFQIPTYDSSGNFMGSVKHFATPMVKAIVKQVGQENRIGFLFDHDELHNEDFNLYNDHCYFIDIKEKDAITSKRLNAFLNFISSINAPSPIGQNKQNQSGKYLYFPVDFIDADTVQYIYDIVDKVFKTMNKDFDKCYYAKGIKNYSDDYDKCGNLHYVERNNYEDSIEVLDVNTNTYIKKVNKSLLNKPIKSIALSFDNTIDIYPFPLYIGVSKNIITQYELDLGYANFYLKEKDIINFSSLVSQKLLLYLKSIYQ